MPEINPSIALTLSAIVRLNMAFETTEGPTRLLLVDCAADCLDRTKPDPSLICHHREGEANQIDMLVNNHALLRPQPADAWPRRRVRPSQWPASHAPALRALERHQKGDAACTRAHREALLVWLAPVWARYPQLQEGARAELGLPV